MRKGSDLNQPSPQSSNDFLQLVLAAKGGSDEAMDRLIRECQPYLLAIANAELDFELSPKVGASDLVQNSMLSAQQCIGNFEGHSREELLAWLRGFLIRDLKQARRHYRAGKRNVARERQIAEDSLRGEGSRLIDSGDSPSTAAARREEELRLYRALESLASDERQVIELRNWQRLPFAEIGDRMNRSPDAARKLWSRAIVKLQRQMDRVDA
jgi:RNA polymerase sigma-70 factor (ECF subfamily)